MDLYPSPIFLLSGTSKVRFADIQMVQIGHPMPSRPETRDPESKLYSHKTGHHKEGILDTVTVHEFGHVIPFCLDGM